MLGALFRRRQREVRAARQDASDFADLVRSPKAGGALTLPAAGVFAIAPKVTSGSTGAAMTVRSSRSPTPRNVGAPALVAGQRHVVGYLETGFVCTPTAAYDLYVDTGLGRWKKILIGG